MGISTTVKRPLEIFEREISENELIPPLLNPRSQMREIVKNVIAPFLITRIALLAIGLTTIYYILPIINPHQPIYSTLQTLHFHQMLYSMWAHFDSGFMTSIARSGYPTGPNALAGMSTWAFFPLYPIVIRLLMWPFGITEPHAVEVGIIISNVSNLIACIYLYKLTTKEFNSIVAQRAVLYMLVYPMSFYLSAVYSEGLFMALSIGCIYHARQRQWLLSGILGGLAALTRPQGVFLILAVGWEYWQVLADRYAPYQLRESHIDTIKEWLHSRAIGLWRSLTALRTWLELACLALIPSGLALFCIYAKWKVGVFLAFIKVEENGWNRYASNPIILVWDAITHPIPASPWTWQFYSYNMAIIFLCWLLFIVILRRMPFIYAILTFIDLYLPLSAGSIGSVGRLYLITFPLYIILAWWSIKSSEWRHTLIFSVFSMFLGIGMMMFVIGIYAMA